MPGDPVEEEYFKELFERIYDLPPRPWNFLVEFTNLLLNGNDDDKESFEKPDYVVWQPVFLILLELGGQVRSSFWIDYSHGKKILKAPKTIIGPRIIAILKIFVETLCHM